MGNLTEAYLELNPNCTRKSANELGRRLLEKVGFSFQELLDQRELNDVYLVEKLKEGVNTDNLNVRIRYLDMIFKLKDRYPTEKNRVEEEHKIIVITPPEESAKEILIKKIDMIAERQGRNESE
jgi:hypothetical protein